MNDLEREALVAEVEARIGPIAPAMRAALLAVDRARFVGVRERARAHRDEPLPLETPYGEGVATVSAPHIYAIAFAALSLSPGDRLLELGSGSGYGAALAAHVVGPAGAVTTVEVDPHLARLALANTAFLPNVRVLHGDGLASAELVAAHEKTWLTFSVAEAPVPLLEALRDKGQLLAPVGAGDEQRFLRYRRAGEKRLEDDLGAVRFVAARALVSP